MLILGRFNDVGVTGVSCIIGSKGFSNTGNSGRLKLKESICCCKESSAETACSKGSEAPIFAAFSANAFRENAEKIGVANPMDEAWNVIAELQSQMRNLSLALPEFPVFENPLLPIMQDTPITPTTLNLPNINTNLVSQQVSGSNYKNLTTQQKIDLLFG